MRMRLFSVVGLTAALFCLETAGAAAVKSIPAPAAAMEGSGGSPQRGEREKDRRNSRLIGAPARPPGAAGGGSHSDRDA